MAVKTIGCMDKVHYSLGELQITDKVTIASDKRSSIAASQQHKSLVFGQFNQPRTKIINWQFIPTGLQEILVNISTHCSNESTSNRNNSRIHGFERQMR
jgi:hypothetical protein